jgi:hypothetical protein
MTLSTFICSEFIFFESSPWRVINYQDYYLKIIIDINNSFICMFYFIFISIELRGSHGRDRMVVGFITTYAIRAYYHFMNSNPTQARCTRYNIMW